MASNFLLWKAVGYLAAPMIFLSGCRRSVSPTLEGSVEFTSPAAPRPSMTEEAPVKPQLVPDDPKATPAPSQIMSSPESQAENQLHRALTLYGAADEQTRTDIEERISELADAGVAKRDIATTLGAMFAMENSIAIKCSILNELYHLQDPSVLEHVMVGLLPNQPLEVRDEAISILEDIGDKRAISSLWPLLADPDENIREQAMSAIHWLENRNAEEFEVRSFRDRYP